ncbi:TetR/AcrR family transcriptional regulator [Spelaeicoccus albus]|uniref:AcrR family transcriptional regulator n=1 Tax=Spelaeicoccus albus TaxID=1280376 RepID=A0A7Z0IHD9_9MICO|nr:TetR/AcrR family transcriptional regulator [Spelaeicoccus albus]NYI67698.1 AcrR family transcriptional regulator [Spelaeicoccus albus]
MSEQTKTRRRGKELEAAILDAAWDQLVADGYDRFTIDAVAERAQTSKPVLYRRWSTRQDLLRAVIRRRGTVNAAPIPDEGSLREDLLALLRFSNSSNGSMAALMTTLVSSHFGDIGMTPVELRAEMFTERSSSLEPVLTRAVRRGEIDAAKLTPRIADLPYALLRHEYLMTFACVPDETLLEIVDDIFLPLVRPN